MFNAFRRSFVGTAVTAVAIMGLGWAGVAGFAAHPVAAASQSFFKADIAVTPAFQQPVGSSVFYYFKITNTGLDSGAVSLPQYRCGIRYHLVGENAFHYRYDYGLALARTYSVNAGNHGYLLAQCNTYSPEDTVIGIQLTGDLVNNIGPDWFSVTVGYVP